MDESQNAVKKSKSFDAIITAINMAIMGTGIAAAVIATNKSRSASSDAKRIEKSVGMLNNKFDKLSEQLKNIQHPAKLEVTAAATKESEKKPDVGAQQQQQKPQQDIIYVRKASEFSFYN